MCPGLTSKGAQMTPVPKGTVVVSFELILNQVSFSNDYFYRLNFFYLVF